VRPFSTASTGKSTAQMTMFERNTTKSYRDFPFSAGKRRFIGQKRHSLAENGDISDKNAVRWRKMAIHRTIMPFSGGKRRYIGQKCRSLAENGDLSGNNAVFMGKNDDDRRENNV